MFLIKKYYICIYKLSKYKKQSMEALEKLKARATQLNNCVSQLSNIDLSDKKLVVTANLITLQTDTEVQLFGWDLMQGESMKYLYYQEIY